MMALWCALFGCGEEASGVDECRALETARCDAAVACGYPEAELCRLYARDHCLRGLSVPDAVATDVEACRLTIESAGVCAERDGDQVLATECAEPLAGEGAEALACDIVLRPETTEACAFLVPTEPVDGQSEDEDADS